MNIKALLLTAAAAPALVAAQDPPPLPSPMTRMGYACEELRYPAASLRAEATGRTVVAFVVSDEGLITQPEVTSSAGRKREHKLLDLVALQHVRSCKLVGAAAVPPGAYSHAFVWVIR